MERDHREAAYCFRDMQNKFKDIEDKIPLDTPVRLAATIDPSSSIPRVAFNSSYDRELWYCCMHAVSVLYLFHLVDVQDINTPVFSLFYKN